MAFFFKSLAWLGAADAGLVVVVVVMRIEFAVDASTLLFLSVYIATISFEGIAESR